MKKGLIEALTALETLPKLQTETVEIINEYQKFVELIADRKVDLSSAHIKAEKLLNKNGEKMNSIKNRSKALLEAVKK